MEIKINNHVLDVSLENEKTVGEVIAALEHWLYSSGHVLSALSIDGQNVPASEIEKIFVKEIVSVKSLDLLTTPLAEIASSSLINLLDDIKEYESLDFDGKNNFFEKWKVGVVSQFISQEMADLYKFCVNTFSNADLSPQILRTIAEERLSEVKEPQKEFTAIEPVLNDICEKLVDLPLDIQTGKDKKAAQTIQLFSAVTEKIFRIFYQLEIQGFFSGEQREKNKEQLVQQITEFTDILKELLDAYEKNDSVLIGDLAEYEASVRIKKLYASILENCRS